MEDEQRARSTPTLIGGLGADPLYRAILDDFDDVTTFVFGEDLRFVDVVGAAVSRIGWRPEELVGRRPSEILRDPDGLVFEEHFRAALRGETRRHERTGMRSTDAVWECTTAPLCDAADRIVGGIVVARDVGPMRRAERALRLEEEAAGHSARLAADERGRRELFEFLADVNDIVADCVDRRDVMRAVTNAAVPRLGDWCTMYVFLDPGDPEPVVEVAHVDPEMVAYARDLQKRFPYDPEARWGVGHVVRTGEPDFYPEITDELLTELEVPAGAAEAVHHLGLRSSITVPLVKRRRVIGAMQFVVADAGRRYGPDDLTLALALGGRVASALENRAMTELQRDIARTLQRSLLPDLLPAVPGAELAVRYWAAGEATEVGGDFYDVFRVDETTHAIVVGDVCGSGPSAAAVTAMARHNVRANAWRGDDHAAVLRHLNEAMLRTWPDTLCTVAYATVHTLGSGLEFTVASAGHPSPILVRGDGTTVPVGTPGLILGAVPTVQHRSSRVELAEGDSVVLYTDGATDVRPPKWLTEEQFAELVASAVTGAPDGEVAADRVFESLQAHLPISDRNDDVALVLIRATSGHIQVSLPHILSLPADS